MLRGTPRSARHRAPARPSSQTKHISCSAEAAGKPVGKPPLRVRRPGRGPGARGRRRARGSAEAARVGSCRHDEVDRARSSGTRRAVDNSPSLHVFHFLLSAAGVAATTSGGSPRQGRPGALRRPLAAWDAPAEHSARAGGSRGSGVASCRPAELGRAGVARWSFGNGATGYALRHGEADEVRPSREESDDVEGRHRPWRQDREDRCRSPGTVGGRQERGQGQVRPEVTGTSFDKRGSWRTSTALGSGPQEAARPAGPRRPGRARRGP